MATCPSCGKVIEEKDKFCNNCGHVLTKSEKTDGSAASGVTGIEPGAPAGPDSEEEKRNRWLEQQKAFQNELSGLKTELKDEIKKKPEMEYPIPSPYARYYAPQGEFDITGRNYAPYNIDPAGIRTAERAGQRENVIEERKPEVSKPQNEAIIEKLERESTGQNSDDYPLAKPATMENQDDEKPQQEAKPAPPKPRVSPKRVKFDENDLIRVDSVLEDDAPPQEVRNPQIAGAIDRILTHEKSRIKPPVNSPEKVSEAVQSKHLEKDQKSKVMTLKLTSPSLKSSTKSSHQVDEIIGSVEMSLRKAPGDFYTKPIEAILANARQKRNENDLDAAFDMAINARKALKRTQDFYRISKVKLAELESVHASIRDPDHTKFRDYQNIKSLMAEGQYHKVNQKIPELMIELKGRDTTGQSGPKEAGNTSTSEVLGGTATGMPSKSEPAVSKTLSLNRPQQSGSPQNGPGTASAGTGTDTSKSSEVNSEGSKQQYGNRSYWKRKKSRRRRKRNR